MSGLEVNKIIASIIVAILVIVIINDLGDIIVNVKHNELAETAYRIEVQQTQNLSEQKEKVSTNIEPISPILVKASLENGKKIFKKCSACHNYQKDGANKVGPNLWNIVNKPKAGVSGFAYSKELSEFGGLWTYEELSNFLYKPKEYIKGTKMNYSGLKKTEDRADLVYFLREQSDTPAPLP